MRYRPDGPRCALCRAVVTADPDHHHPWSQVIVWLWDSHTSWRVLLLLGGACALSTLTAVIVLATQFVREIS